MFLTTG